MNTLSDDVQKKVREVVKDTLAEFADAQFNLGSDACREVISYKIASELLKEFALFDKQKHEIIYEMT